MKKKPKPHRGFWIFFRIQLVLLLLLVAGLLYYLLGGYAGEIHALRESGEQIARASSPEDFRTAETSIVYAADGTVISTLSAEKDSYYLTADKIPYDVKAAIVSVEDKKFYDHKGVDPKAIARAVLAMLKNGEPTQGGSTITQQLARNIYLTMDRTWQRKMEEIFLAKALEKKYTKDQILEFYLNNIYFANGYYGIEAASRGYFQKHTSDLSLSEICFLLAIPNNPSLYDPLTNMENTLARRDRILKYMYDDQIISTSTYHLALEEPIVLNQSYNTKNVYVETYAYYCATRALMEMKGFPFLYKYDMGSDLQAQYDKAYGDMYAVCQKELYTGGYRIYTSLDLTMQQELQDSIDQGLQEFQEVSEEGVYTMQSAGVCISNDTGLVTAVVGGRSQSLPGYTLNRAYQSFRQPGSSIKPLIVYTPCLERGYTPDTMVVDEKKEDGPSNAGGGYAGEMTLRQAVALSKNTVAHQLFLELSPSVGLSYLDKLHFTHISARDLRPAVVLGGFTYGASPVEMTSGFAAIENDGVFRAPTCVRRITDAEGNVLYEAPSEGEQVYKKNASRMMTDMLTSVITEGTGRGLDLGEMPCAGKTGTTNDNKDGWFVGYTRYYTTGIWVGYDLPRSFAGLSGNSYPGHIWQDYMLKIHDGLAPLEFLPYLEVTPEEPEELTEPGVPGQEEAPVEQKSPVEMTPEEHQRLWEEQLRQIQEYLNAMNGL